MFPGKVRTMPTECCNAARISSSPSGWVSYASRRANMHRLSPFRQKRSPSSRRSRLAPGFRAGVLECVEAAAQECEDWVDLSRKLLGRPRSRLRRASVGEEVEG